MDGEQHGGCGLHGYPTARPYHHWSGRSSQQDGWRATWWLWPQQDECMTADE